METLPQNLSLVELAEVVVANKHLEEKYLFLDNGEFRFYGSSEPRISLEQLVRANLECSAVFFEDFQAQTQLPRQKMIAATVHIFVRKGTPGLDILEWFARRFGLFGTLNEIRTMRDKVKIGDTYYVPGVDCAIWPMPRVFMSSSFTAIEDPLGDLTLESHGETVQMRIVNARPFHNVCMIFRENDLCTKKPFRQAFSYDNKTVICHLGVFEDVESAILTRESDSYEAVVITKTQIITNTTQIPRPECDGLDYYALMHAFPGAELIRYRIASENGGIDAMPNNETLRITAVGDYLNDWVTAIPNGNETKCVEGVVFYACQIPEFYVSRHGIVLGAIVVFDDRIYYSSEEIPAGSRLYSGNYGEGIMLPSGEMYDPDSRDENPTKRMRYE